MANLVWLTYPIAGVVFLVALNRLVRVMDAGRRTPCVDALAMACIMGGCAGHAITPIYSHFSDFDVFEPLASFAGWFGFGLWFSIPVVRRWAERHHWAALLKVING